MKRDRKGKDDEWQKKISYFNELNIKWAIIVIS